MLSANHRLSLFSTKKKCLHYNILSIRDKTVKGDKVKASQSKVNNSKTGKISKLKSLKGAMPYASVDVGYHSLEC